MNLRQPRSTRTNTLLPYTTLGRSALPFSRHSPPIASSARGHNCPTCARSPSIRAFATAAAAPKPAQSAGESVPDLRPGPSCPPPCMNGATATPGRSEEHTSELQSLMRISYAVFCLKKKHVVLFQFLYITLIYMHSMSNLYT